ncbi:MAG: hypothetical protein QM754_13200 [Tepidisphaeraceae bacterium]
MRNLIFASVAGVLLTAVILGRPAADAQGRPSSGEEQRRTQQWDYTVVTVFGNVISIDGKELGNADFLTVLRRLGNDGWELTATTRGVAMEKDVQYVFKRQRN